MSGYGSLLKSCQEVAGFSGCYLHTCRYHGAVSFPVLCIKNSTEHFCTGSRCVCVCSTCVRAYICICVWCVERMSECMYKLASYTLVSFTRQLPRSHCCSLSPVLMAYRYWILGHHWKFLCLSGLAIIVFRTELSILLGLMLLGEVLSGRLSVYHTIKICVPAGAAILGEIVCTEHPVHVHW